MAETQRLTLRDVALRASERVGGLQGRALDREAKRRGLRLSYTTVDKIIAGTYRSKPRPETLDALAELSGFSREDVYAAAGEPMSERSLAEDLPPDADLLTPAQRRVVVDAVRLFARQNRVIAESLQGRTGDELPPSLRWADIPPGLTWDGRRPDDLVTDGDLPMPPADTPEPGEAPSRRDRRG